MGKALGKIPCPACDGMHIMKRDKNGSPYLFCPPFFTTIWLRGNDGPAYIQRMKEEGKFLSVEEADMPTQEPGALGKEALEETPAKTGSSKEEKDPWTTPVKWED